MSWFADPAYPANLPSLWDRNWGYLQRQNVAPVLMGEFGTKLGTESDAAWRTSRDWSSLPLPERLIDGP